MRGRYPGAPCAWHIGSPAARTTLPHRTTGMRIDCFATSSRTVLLSPSTLVLGGAVKTLGCNEPPPELGTWGGGEWVVHPADVPPKRGRHQRLIAGGLSVEPNMTGKAW
jgi:hypothetical protein